MAEKKNGTTGDDASETGSTPPEQVNPDDMTAEPVASDAADTGAAAESTGFADAKEPEETPAEPAADSDPGASGSPDEWNSPDDPIELKSDPNAPTESEAATISATPPHVVPADPATSPEPERPTAAEAPEAGHDQYGYEEEAGPSFASRALLVLVLLLAGAVAGIWAAPKIASSLPAGMAPVAAWMMPGATLSQDSLDRLEADVTAQVATLEEEVRTLRGELAAVPGQEALDARIADHVGAAVLESEARASDALSAAVAETDTRIAGAVKAAVDDIAAPETRQQLARLQNSLEGQIAQLDDLKTQLQGGIAATAQSTEATAANIDIYRSELEGLRAEVGDLTDSVAGLRERIDTVAATADRSIASAQADLDAAKAAFTDALAASKTEFDAALSEAQDVVEETRESAETAMTEAAIEADIAQIAAALGNAQPYSEPVARLEAGGVAVPAGLAENSADGVPTLLMLRESFSPSAHEAIRAGIVSGAGQGLFSRAQAYLEAQVSNRSLAPKEGLDTDAVLSRMEEALRREDLAGALAEAGHLPSEAAAAMQSWLTRARARAEADAGLVELKAGHPATN